MNRLLTIYHGSKQVVEVPIFGAGREHNDFGLGFYCTESNDLAKEWAVSSLNNGFSNRYTLDMEYLNILRLNSPDYTILNWIAVLVRHRLFTIKNPVAARAKRYLLDYFYVNVNAYDLVIGYRADDSYFSFAQDFIAGAISLNKLSEAMRLGKLGEQTVLKSEKSYTHIKFLGAEPAEAGVWYEKKAVRDRTARREYRKSRTSSASVSEIYMLDIMREGMTNDDPRLR